MLDNYFDKLNGLQLLHNKHWIIAVLKANYKL